MGAKWRQNRMQPQPVVDVVYDKGKDPRGKVERRFAALDVAHARSALARGRGCGR